MRAVGRSHVSSVAVTHRPRTPGVVYAVVAVCLVVLVGALALTSRRVSPPTIAEFAPQAVEQITDTSQDGGEAGGAANAGSEVADDHVTRTEEPTTVDVARVRQCVGEPPRQIEDPQSPPCVPYWSGDNGGATSKGVTRDEIRLVYNDYSASDRYWDALAAFFNKRFEFYGRRLRLFRASTACDWSSLEAQEAMAIEADEQFRAFGAFGNCVFRDEVYARRGLMFANMHGILSNAFHQRWQPYTWTYDIEMDGQLATYGSWMCSRLAGRRARFAGTPDLQSRPRTFGLFIASMIGQPVDDSPLLEALGSCGERFGHIVRSTWSTTDFVYEDASNVVLQMRERGITSIVVLSHYLDTIQLGNAASLQGYFPEWNTSTYVDMDWNNSMHWANQKDHAFGLSFSPKWNTPQNIPAVWATTETDPGLDWWTGTASETAIVTILEYRGLLLLASGIQMAGPNLTPHTFAAALHKTVFPNPETPLRAGRVGFNNGDYGMIEDAAEIWWSSSARNPWNGAAEGAWCYVDGGVRARSWPNEPSKAFQGPCDSGI